MLHRLLYARTHWTETNKLTIPFNIGYKFGMKADLKVGTLSGSDPTIGVNARLD